MRHRTTASAALLIMLGTTFATVPASVAATNPAVRLSGELVRVADEQGPGLAAIRMADNTLVPIDVQKVGDVTSGSTLAVDVLVPAEVRIAAAANRTLRTLGAGGKETAVPLRASDLASASDGSPESLTSAIGRATVAQAVAPGSAALVVSKVVAAAADPVSTFTPATRRIYVAVVTPYGATPEPTVDESRIRAQVAGASSYWRDVTGGALTLSVVSITGQYTSAFSCLDDPFKIWNEAADRVGFTSAANTSLVLELPKSVLSTCGYGKGTIGGSPNDWGFVRVADNVWPVLAHELGHNMSLQHADALRCPTAADSAYSTPPTTTTKAWTGTDCEEASYGDGQDVMSASRSDFAPSLSAPQALRTGIIPPSATTVIDTVGTRSVTLLPLAGGTGMRAAEVVNPITGVTYYAEYRTPAGRDLLNVFDGMKTGVRVLRYNPDTGATVLLDPSPSSETRDLDPTLPVGRRFTSYDGGVSISTVSANSTNAVLSITTSTSQVTAPEAPTAVVATAGNSAALVSWTTPAVDGRAPVTGYSISASPGGKTVITDGTATSLAVTGLSNGTTYTFTVTATNAIGTSAASAPSAGVTPAATAPGAPTAVTATAGDRSATVSWTAPSDGGGSPITGYSLTASPGGKTVPVDGTVTSLTVSGLSNGTAYTFIVTATNAAGTSSASVASAAVTPKAPPAIPTKVTVSIPAKAYVGPAITASTQVTDQYGKAQANWIVTLQKIQIGTSAWGSVKSLRTTSTGAASYRFANGVSGYYRWVTAAAPGAASKVSVSVRVTSTARVVQRRPATSMTRGRYLSVSGSVSSVRSPLVYIQYRYTGGAWRTGPRATVRGTAVSGKVKLTGRRTAYTRLYVKTATSYLGSVSRSYSTKVR